LTRESAYWCIADLVFPRCERMFGAMAMFDKRRGARIPKLLCGCLCVLAAGASDPARADATPSVIPAATVRPTLSQHIVAGSRPSTLRKLLDAGADPLLPDRHGDTVVHYAAAAQNPAYLELLLARGLDPDTRNRVSGRTPLMSAMLYERGAQFRMLLAAGASTSQADAMGNTPLHIAAQINEPGHVLTLLEAGAPPTARNAQGQTFQRYLFMTPTHLLNEETSRARAKVTVWLQSHGIALEAGTP
jgi:ankyrin repeat protein